MSVTYVYDVFLSHSSEDKSVVHEIAERLKGDGLRVWLDESMPPGALWRRELEIALGESKAFVLCMSQNAFKSEWVKVEFDLALSRDPNNLRARLILVLLEDCEIPPMLKRFVYVDWREKSSEQYQRLLEACRRADQIEASLNADARMPFSIPPDEGFQPQRTSEVLTALALDKPDFQSLPLDLSSAWGLDRGSFTGVLAGRPDDGIYHALLRTEVALWRCLRESAGRPALSVRWWLRIGIRPSPPPETLEQIWDAVEEQRSDRLAYLRERGLSKDLLLGFFLELRSLDLEFPAYLLSWWESLVRLFPSHSLALVFDAPGPGASAFATALRRLSHHQIPRPMRVDALFLFPLRIMEPPPVSEVPLPAQLRSLIPGLVTQIGMQGTADSSEEELEARRLIESLDANPGRALGVYRELLEWISQSRPALFLPLFRACARSACAQGRRESLVFATRADVWLDVWLAEADLSQPRAIIEFATPADPESGVLVDHLALALMRRLDWVGDPESLEALLAALSPRLSRELHSVDRLRRRELKIDDFLSTSGPREQQLALRAGLSLWPSRKLLEIMDLDCVDFWRLLTAMPVNGARISDLLSLPDPARRAIFGLCTAREWAAIANDATLARLVLEGRRGRPLDIDQER